MLVFAYMLKHLKRGIGGIVRVFSVCVAVFSFIGMVAIIVMEMNVRFTTNQAFAFLGGGALDVLIGSVFALILVLAIIYRPAKERKSDTE